MNSNPRLESDLPKLAMNRRDFLLTSAFAVPALFPRPAWAQGQPVADLPPAEAEARPLKPRGKRRLKTVILEMSPKPFRDLSEPAVRAVCRDVFRQWEPLTRDAEEISILLWTADGSEILDYNGQLDDPIEWARYIGLANIRFVVEHDPEKKALHSRSHLYTAHPAELTYRRLAMIIRAFKEVGAETTGQRVRVGATFDPGPEFAKSPFKYERHNEVCLGSYHAAAGSFICCYGVLKGDRRPYAGFPAGIPDQTPFGTFFGRQCQHFLTDLKFDYIWFSNGFGFGRETWKATGPLFDGVRFDAAPAADLRAKVLSFWSLFRKECPDFPVETRGTNLLTGSDLATNATPLKELYEGGFNFVPPPNSPWAAIDGDVGLEIAGYLSRIAELPNDEGFPYRFYTHDPWWLNSPWLDRYGREPFDIYLPMAVSRINRAGRVETPDSVAFLTIDNSYGERPDQVPNEVIPHIQEALNHAPDQPGPLVWVYPLTEYERMTFGPQSRLDEPFFGDWFIRSAMNNGLPLNTVVSSDNFVAAAGGNAARYRESVLLATVPDADTPLARALLAHVQAGGRVLLYGPLGHAGDTLWAALHLQRAPAIAGECTLEVVELPDQLTERAYPNRLLHRPAFCAGGMDAVPVDSRDPRTRVMAWAIQGDQRRVAAASCELGHGRLTWVRGTNSNSHSPKDLLPYPDDPLEFFPGDLLLRFALDAFGYRVAVRKRTPAQGNPVLTIARHGNGFFLSGYNRDLACDLKLRFPQGAPLLVGMETQLEDGAACYRMPRSLHKECRIFVEQAAGELGCVEQCSAEIGVKRRLKVTGLQDAVVRFYPEGDLREPVRFLRNPVDPFLIGDFLTPEPRDDRFGRHLAVGPVSGSLLVSW
jgi:hypothetical protein